MSQFEKKIDVDYLRDAARQTAAIKQRSYELLALQQASAILDIGCGPGIDLIEMAHLAPAQTRIVGIDNDPVMLDAANAALQAANLENRIELVKGSAIELPFADASFDRVRAERLFQVISPRLASDDTIFNEALRVVAPGGRMVLADTDWATVSIDFSDLELERRLMRFFADS